MPARFRRWETHATLSLDPYRAMRGTAIFILKDRLLLSYACPLQTLHVFQLSVPSSSTRAIGCLLLLFILHQGRRVAMRGCAR